MVPQAINSIYTQTRSQNGIREQKYCCPCFMLFIDDIICYSFDILQPVVHILYQVAPYFKTRCSISLSKP